MYYSPLRYPGGKSKLGNFITKICIENNLRNSYLEPYAGGASVGLQLLINDIVDHIYINDADKSIYAFWYCLVNHPEVLIQVIHDTEINMSNWRYYKEFQLKKDTCDILDLAVSTFFLNRTNRSGILKAGVIGGNSQEGNYKIDCRFNKKELIKRLQTIADFRGRITVTNLDALDLIDLHQSQMSNVGKLAYLDPPYYYKADSLYMNHYKPNDHKSVAEKIISVKEFNYIISYDDTEEIRNLYSSLSSKQYSFKHNIINSRDGREILFFDDNLIVDNLETRNPVNYRKHKNSGEIVYVE